MQSSEELWEQNYEEMMGSIPDLLLDDVSPSARSKSKGGWCNGPKGGVEKPVRRRSRSSKKAPTTLLTADANNFRALVQQFTGWHSATPLLRAYRGPINLNFKQCSYYPQQQQQQQNLKVHVESNFVPPFGAKTMINAGLDELFVPGMGESPRGDGDGALTFDNFWGSGDYSTVLSAVDHAFWGY